MKVIVDTGPIVAFFDKNEHNHHFVLEQMQNLEGPFYTCEAVLSEALFLLGKKISWKEKFLSLLASGKIEVPFSYSNHAFRVQEIIQTYKNLPSSFADACLLCMAETTPESRVFTLDGDFSIYRTSQGDSISLISPDP